MVSYHFFRFAETSTGRKDAEHILNQHKEFVQGLSKSGNVITEGIFEPTGSIVILKEELNSDAFESDPAIPQGLISVDHKKLWIAKGSFCEP